MADRAVHGVQQPVGLLNEPLIMATASWESNCLARVGLKLWSNCHSVRSWFAESNPWRVRRCGSILA